MEKREVKFSLVFRDMWQSAGKYVPRVDQLVKVAPAIIRMGCFDRVETNGGGFEQVNLLFGENPNNAVRQWTKPFHEAGIQTHMLDRALNGLRMSPVPADVRRLFYKVKKAQGTDITRTFCGLNDIRNIAPSIRYAKEAGMISQCSLCITHSPIHTVDYYVDMARQLIDLGCDEICLKDMAGIGRPETLGKICAGIKAAHDLGAQIGIVVGGGNFWRGRSSGKMDRMDADKIGMLATVMNALAVKDALRQQGVDAVVMTSSFMPQVAECFTSDKAIAALESGKIVVFGGGTGNPIFSTDTASALRALEIGADAMFKATMVDGVYDKDPHKYADAVRYDTLTFTRVLDERLAVMDSTAATLCRDNGLPIVVFDLNEPANIARALQGENVGTIVRE